MGPYTKSSINRAARPRSERLRRFGGAIVSTSASVIGGGGYIPSGETHSHANLADLNMITVSDGYIYLTDTYTDEISGDQVTETVKVMAGYADRAGANADGYTLDWFIPVTVNGSLTLKLNPIYAGLWAEGWMAEGGVGSSGGGGGGGSTVSVTQILTSGTSIATITVDGVATTLFAPSGGGGGSSVSWGTTSDYKSPLTVDGTTKTVLLNGALTEYATQASLSGYLPLTGGTMTGAVTMSGANILTAVDSANQIGSVDHRFRDGYIRNIYLTYLGFRSDDGATQYGNISIGDGYSSIYINTTGGVSQYVFNAVYGFFHGGDGDLPCGRSDHRWSKVWAVDADLSGALTISGNITPAADITSYLGSSARRFHTGHIVNIGTRNINFYNQASGVKDAAFMGGDGYLRLRTGADIDTAYKDIVFHENYGFYPEQSGVNLGYGSAAQYRWANIYGVNADLTGDLTLSSSSTVSIGPVTITYDATNKALHITGTDNGQTVGIYCDGWFAEGGLPQNS